MLLFRGCLGLKVEDEAPAGKKTQGHHRDRKLNPASALADVNEKQRCGMLHASGEWQPYAISADTGSVGQVPLLPAQNSQARIQAPKLNGRVNIHPSSVSGQEDHSAFTKGVELPQDQVGPTQRLNLTNAWNECLSQQLQERVVSPQVEQVASRTSDQAPAIQGHGQRSDGSASMQAPPHTHELQMKCPSILSQVAARASAPDATQPARVNQHDQQQQQQQREQQEEKHQRGQQSRREDGSCVYSSRSLEAVKVQGKEDTSGECTARGGISMEGDTVATTTMTVRLYGPPFLVHEAHGAMSVQVVGQPLGVWDKVAGEGAAVPGAAVRVQACFPSESESASPVGACVPEGGVQDSDSQLQQRTSRQQGQQGQIQQQQQNQEQRQEQEQQKLWHHVQQEQQDEQQKQGEQKQGLPFGAPCDQAPETRPESGQQDGRVVGLILDAGVPSAEAEPACSRAPMHTEGCARPTPPPPPSDPWQPPTMQQQEQPQEQVQQPATVQYRGRASRDCRRPRLLLFPRRSRFSSWGLTLLQLCIGLACVAALPRRGAIREQRRQRSSSPNTSTVKASGTRGCRSLSDAVGTDVVAAAAGATNNLAGVTGAGGGGCRGASKVAAARWECESNWCHIIRPPSSQRWKIM